MEWLDRLNNSLEYIEENLDNGLSYEKAARIACCSVNHYQRMFSFISNITLGEYVRRRRLTMAAFDLQNTNMSVLDISLKFGYNSPTAFTRAFIAMHGVTPTKARRFGTSLKSYPRISFQISVKGDKELVYKIEEKESLKIVGIKESVINDGVYNRNRIPQMWAEARENGVIYQIASYSDNSYSGMMGLCSNFRDNLFDYYIGVVSGQNVRGMEELIIKEGIWAVFECIGLSSIQPTWTRIFTEWFPSSGYEIADAPEIEWYPNSNNSNSEEYKTEIWIPIRSNRIVKSNAINSEKV